MFFYTRLFVSLFFFFSSRRRHTRCYRDWSSDVCSSDLRPDGRQRAPWHDGLSSEKVVEFAVLDAFEKRADLCVAEQERWPVGLPGVADGDPAAWQLGGLDAIACGAAALALAPLHLMEVAGGHAVVLRWTVVHRWLCLPVHSSRACAAGEGCNWHSLLHLPLAPAIAPMIAHRCGQSNSGGAGGRGRGRGERRFSWNLHRRTGRIRSLRRRAMEDGMKGERRWSGLALLALALCLLAGACTGGGRHPARSGTPPASTRPASVHGETVLKSSAAPWRLPAPLSGAVALQDGSGALLLGGLERSQATSDQILRVDLARGTATPAGR